MFRRIKNWFKSRYWFKHLHCPEPMLSWPLDVQVAKILYIPHKDISYAQQAELLRQFFPTNELIDILLPTNYPSPENWSLGKVIQLLPFEDLPLKPGKNGALLDLINHEYDLLLDLSLVPDDYTYKMTQLAKCQIRFRQMDASIAPKLFNFEAALRNLPQSPYDQCKQLLAIFAYQGSK